jgi:hypothetical protein
MEDLDKSFAGAEGFIEAESNTHKPHPNEFCLNCGTKLLDTYCHHCGQKDIPRRQALGDLLSNIIESFTNYEGKFLQTAKYLFSKPGFLAVEYNSGRRDSYFHPVRMYVFVSALFFLLFVVLPDSDTGAADAGLTAEDREALSEAGIGVDTTTIDSLRKKGKVKWTFKDPQYKSMEQYDSVQQTLPEEKRDNWFERLMQRRSIELKKKYGNDANALGKDFLASFSDHFSTVLFYLMPLMAWVLKLLYIRRDHYYSEHLSFTIYYYCFFYLAGSAIMILNLLPADAGGITAVLISMWIYFYLLFAMKRMYKQGWGKTIVKFGAFTFLFSILILLGVMINGVVSLMMI